MIINKAFVDTSVILRILIKDDDDKRKNSIALIKDAKSNGLSLYILPIALIETVFVLEKVYKLPKETIKELVEAILNTPEFKIESEDIFRNAISEYVDSNIKFGDALMFYWGFNIGISVVYTYDNKDFKRIKGLEVRNP